MSLTKLSNLSINPPYLPTSQNFQPTSSSNQAPNTGDKIGPISQDKTTPQSQQLNTLSEKFDEKILKQLGIVECATCASRTYQDVSDDSGVSFQTPTQLDPSEAASAVIAHEGEHVTRERADAEENNREVVSQSVRIHTSICPECGRSYVSGGVTTTVTKGKEGNYSQNKTNDFVGNLMDVTL